MARWNFDQAWCIVALGTAVGLGCSTAASKPSDGGTTAPPDGGTGGARGQLDAGTDTGDDDPPQDLVACRVAMDNPLNPCAPTSTAQDTRYLGTDFGMASVCPGQVVHYQTRQGGHVWDCTYYGGEGRLAAWDRIEPTQLCDGRASAVLADIWSKDQGSCLTVDSGEWTWLLGFDPGPPTIAVRLGTDPTASRSTLSVGLAFTLSGGEIAGSALTMRYWYTSDPRGGARPSQSVTCGGGTGITCDFIAITLVPVTPARATADSYAEISFPMIGLSTGFDILLGFEIARSDGALYDQSNDYSYNGTTELTATRKVTAYVDGRLIYGTEP